MPHTESLRLNTPGYKDVCQIHPTDLGNSLTANSTHSCKYLVASAPQLTTCSMGPPHRQMLLRQLTCPCAPAFLTWILGVPKPFTTPDCWGWSLTATAHAKNRTGSCRYALLESTQPRARITLRLPCCPGFQDYTYLKTVSITVQNCTSADSVYLL